MTQQFPRWRKLVAALMAATGLVLGSAGLLLSGWGYLLLAERTPKAVADWIALVFLGGLMAGLLICIVVLLWMLFRVLKQKTT